MTKHRDVNKCRRKEKCKTDARIRQANKRVQLEMANKPETRKNAWWKMKRKEREREKQQHFSEKKQEERNVSEQRDKGWLQVIRVHDTTPHSYIVNKRYNSRNKRANQEKKKNSEWQELVTSPTGHFAATSPE